MTADRESFWQIISHFGNLSLEINVVDH